MLGGDPLTNPQQTCDPATNLPKPNTAATGPIEIFGNAESILLNSSDHPFIANNDILGAAIFQFSPVLATGQVLTGFGIVTGECLGLGPDVSDSVTIINNLIARNVNAAIWLCSDGGGLHQIKANVVRNNGRGIVLRAIDDTTLDQNQITDDYQDAIVIYDASNNNTLSNNTIESNETPGAAGIRLGGFGAGLFPLATTLSGNTLLRNWVDVVITGARNTQLFGNTITADKNRTGILIQVGSQGAQAYTQPDGTFVGISGQTANKIISNGQCGATSGCAIRLDQGVTSNVDATGTFNPATAIPGPTPPPTTSSVSFNNFGLPPGADINTVLWHRPNDPTLGFINTGTNLIPASPVAGTTGVVATISPATPSPTPSPTPNAGM